MLNKFRIISVIMAVVLVNCSQPLPRFPYRIVPHSWVYHLEQHNDSIYFSTLEDGIFRFSPDHPKDITRVGGFRKMPFRSIVFRRDGRLFGSSYYAGVFQAGKDTLTPVKNAAYPAWSMKMDDKGALWLAASQGVLHELGDTLVLFADIRDAHDIAVWGDTVAVAHLKGVSLFERNSGKPAGKRLTGTVCWTLARFDSSLVVGGSSTCAIFSDGRCRRVYVPPGGNMVWSIAQDFAGCLFLGTQKGLFRVGRHADTAECIGCDGECVKSVLLDKNGVLWVGAFRTAP